MWRERGVRSGLLRGACIQPLTAGTSGVARADDLSPCQLSPFESLDYSYQAGLHMDGAVRQRCRRRAPVRGDLGAGSRSGLAYRSGSLTFDEAKAAIIAALPGQMAPDAADYMAARLHVDPMPYNLAELVGVQAAIVGRFLAAKWGVGWGFGIGCTTSDAFRVEATLYKTARPRSAPRRGPSSPTTETAPDCDCLTPAHRCRRRASARRRHPGPGRRRCSQRTH